MTIDPELLEAARKNELVIFVGAGLSYDFVNIRNEKLGDWNNLIVQLIAHLESKKFDVTHLKALVGIYPPIKILDLIESNKTLSKKYIYEFTKDFFDLVAANNYSLHKSLFTLSQKIITTNYDNAFEWAVPELKKNTAFKGRNYELTTFKDRNKPLLFKLHGCYESTDSLVLFPSDYNELYNGSNRDEKHSLSVLNNLISSKTVLFVGTGMGDHQINSIFQEFRRLQGKHAQKHFIFTKNDLDSKLDFLTAIKISEFVEIQGIVDALIKARDEFFENQKSPEIKYIEKVLGDAQKELSELRAYKAQQIDKEESRNQKAIRYFIDGLSNHLTGKLWKAIECYQMATDLNDTNATTYNSWGLALYILGNQMNDESLFQLSFEKFDTAAKLNPDDPTVLNNWGTALSDLAKLKSDKELYSLCFEKYAAAAKMAPSYLSPFYNWGTGLLNLARLEGDEHFYKLSIDKLRAATERDVNDSAAYCNWGIALHELGMLQKAPDHFEEAFEKFEIAARLDAKDTSALNNWALAVTDCAELKKDYTLFGEAFEKYKVAASRRPYDSNTYFNWGLGLSELAKLTSDAGLFRESFNKFTTAAQLEPSNAAIFCKWGIAIYELAMIEKQEKTFTESFNKFETAAQLDPADSFTYYAWGTSLSELAYLKKDPTLFELGVEKFVLSQKINPDYASVYINWGNAVLKLATLRNDPDLYRQSIDILTRSFDLNGLCYDLACAYALLMKEERAFFFLERSLSLGQIQSAYVRADSDWSNYFSEPNFQVLVNKY